MTDKERADVLRKAADIMTTEWDGELTDYMREYADGLDPPYTLDRSLRGWVIVDTLNGEGVFWADSDGFRQFRIGVVCLTWDKTTTLRYKVAPLRVLQPDEVVVKIPPVSEWPDNCYCVRVVFLFESDTGRTLDMTFENSFDRDDMQRMLDPNMYTFLGQGGR